MDAEIEEEFDRFLSEMQSNTLEHGLFLHEDDYEDEYSHNQIRTAQTILGRKIAEYLQKKYPDKYCVYADWCVHVMTVQFAVQHKVRRYEDYLA